MFLTEISMKTIRMIEDIFQQGDPRYEDFDNALMVATFLQGDAIKITKEWVTDIEVTNKEMKGVTSPQQDYKVIARRLFEKKGYEFAGYEVSIHGGRVDILAKKNNEILAVECCACRINKAIHVLERENTVLWILSYNIGEFPIKKLPLYIVKRGPNWGKYSEKYNQYRNKRFKGIKSPLERLYEEENNE